MQLSPLLSLAEQPSWELRSDGTLWSPLFDDRYYSGTGIEESTLVFLQGNHLEERWRALPQNEDMTLVEVGLGSGLNFALAAELWCRLRTEGTLHYIGIEGWPLDLPTLEAVHSSWPVALNPWGARLRQEWPNGFSATEKGSRVELQLLTLPLEQALLELPLEVDAWFLDGFSPEKNPSAWDDGLFAAMGRKTPPGGTAATFTVSGSIRRRLIASGFEVQKLPGFGEKRARLEAHRIASDEKSALRFSLQEALHQASAKGEPARVEAILKEGAHPDAEALHLALRSRQGSVLSALLHAGGDPDSINIKGYTLLIEAIRFSDKELEQLLIDAGASEHRTDFKGRNAQTWRVLRRLAPH